MFEAWLQSDESPPPDACPICGSARLEKCLSAPAVKTSNHALSPEVERVQKGAAEAAEACADFNQKMGELREALRAELRRAAASAKDVGDAFSETVRSMAKGEAKSEPVKGKCTPVQTAELLSEGIGVLPLPDDLEDLN